MSARSALEVFSAYGRENFDLAESPEADGVLFQAGIFGFTGRPLYTVSFVRRSARPKGWMGGSLRFARIPDGA
jgi:hypothetical protein